MIYRNETFTFCQVLHVTEYNKQHLNPKDYWDAFRVRNGDLRKTGYVLHRKHIQGGMVATLFKTKKQAIAHFERETQAKTFIPRN